MGQNELQTGLGRGGNVIGSATPQEIYLWAFKVHIGLIHRNASLKVDIRSPSSPFFWEIGDFGSEIWLFRRLYQVWSMGGTICPDPFGTVLRSRALTRAPSFDFVHNLQSGTLFFQLGEEVVFVALYDKGALASSNVAEQLEYHRDFLSTAPSQDGDDLGWAAQRVWACETAYFLYRARTGFSYVSSEESFTAVPDLFRPAPRSSDAEEYARFCLSFGLKLETFGGEAGHHYSNSLRKTSAV
ncbi:hypothetical protein [Aurantimonas endophytica]|uniref:Uncharacterized protein n=1 Tax=Aurantimonas endophytica TaxID=1522175 RepID=A0A7W6H9T2_9HYPH|nr:hypothetical protein [Aurantimonas endophytica]MBB4001269.1 hypothetical protein [Aurantimonas endophytica]